MLRIVNQRRGWSRRTVLEAAGTGLFGLSLPKLFAAEATAPVSVVDGGRPVTALFG